MQNIPDYEMTKPYTPYYFQVQQPGGEGFNYSTKTGQVAGRQGYNATTSGFVQKV